VIPCLDVSRRARWHLDVGGAIMRSWLEMLNLSTSKAVSPGYPPVAFGMLFVTNGTRSAARLC
jgi:hypothetical protein